MAFTSGLTITVNNFIVKATAIGKNYYSIPENYKLSNFIPLFSVDFGVIMAVRGLMQIPVMFTIIALQGKLYYLFLL